MEATINSNLHNLYKKKYRPIIKKLTEYKNRFFILPKVLNILNFFYKIEIILDY
jgi:hypothetical protein